MESYKLVLPEHLNHYGYLFGGNMLKWVDELSWIKATTDYPCCEFVTIAMDKVEFRKGVRQGNILRFEIEQSNRGSSSVEYLVSVYRQEISDSSEEQVFSNHITFVCLDDDGQKRPLEC